MKTTDITTEMFNDMLYKIIDESSASLLLSIPGVYALVKEEYSDEVLKRLENLDPLDLPMRPYMTKTERMKQLGLAELTFDYALPQTWLDQCVDALLRNYPGTYGLGGGLNPSDVLTRGLVWLYDKHGGLFGRPYPITHEAKQALKALPRKLSGLTQSDIQKPEEKE